MPRNLFNDKLQAHQYHLLDVDFSLAVPPWVLSPSAGFSAITSPEITIETKDVTEGTDPFVHHTLGKASTGVITLQKGLTSFNADFWRWIMACLHGKATKKNLLEFIAGAATGQGIASGKRRNLILMSFTGMSLEGAAIATAKASGIDVVKNALLLGTAGTVTALATGLETITGGIVDLGITSIPGKVFMLMECLPTRIKFGTDFDANSGDISIEELDIQPHRVEEFSLFA